MGYIPFGFKPIEPSTWVYLSSLLMLALFFKFNRFWSIRNFDLILIILLAPGLLMVHYGESQHAEDTHFAAINEVISEAIIPSEVDESGSKQRTVGSESEAGITAGSSSDTLNPATSGSRVPGLNPSLPIRPGENSEEGDSKNQSKIPESSSLTEQPALPKQVEQGGVSTSEPDPDSVVRGANPLSRGQKRQRYGYVWLFSIGAFWILRLFYDPMLVRKPMLEPNLTVGGLVFLACSLTIFLFANVLLSKPGNLAGAEGAVNLVQRNAQEAGDQLQKYGPGYPLLHVIPAIQTFRDKDNDSVSATPEKRTQLVEVARVMAILSQIAIVLGLFFIGNVHFGNFQMGVAMATIFLMLPYTAQFAGDSMHLLPGALLVWAVALFHRPMASGVLIGVSAGVCYYPLFLLPLWISFYWERGRMRFLMGAMLAILLVVSSLILTSVDFSSFVAQLKSIFGFILPRQGGLGGIWALNWESWFRLPFLVGFIVLCFSFVFWPATKDLSGLISCTAAAMLAVQYWHGDGGGLYMAWYLPLILLVIFRPNLDHKIATSVLTEKRRKKRAVADADSSGLDYAA